ncbi:hypothetical protein FIN92_07610 [Prevotella brunnea]|uniref:hypothetical protein n=1 Tax=Prevotella brunnea TaxID=2508867 RepID=UPI00283047C2|nr:hypothetical protein [Prevotella brunnea]MDR0186438.1 hypothetical protein [Prevotella brunnea]
MKTKLFISFVAFAAASVLMSGCSNEESTATTNDQLTAFTGGIVTEAPMERVQIGTSDSSTGVPGFTTRTSMNRNGIGGQGAFLWEPKDVIHVEDDNGKLYKSQNAINDAVARTTFLVDGSYTTKGQYDVYYCGTNSSASEKKVVIASNQTQVAFNNTKHFGAAGDCGVAKATKTTVAGKSGYRFDLEHKASYLCFLPYMTIKAQRANFRIQSIEITSDNNIAGTYDLTQTGLSGTGNAKTITLHVGTDGLLLANQTAETPNIDNSLYVVIAPGTHALKVKYTFLGAKNTVMTITKSYKSHNFGANKICDIPVNLGVRHYSGRNYYMWDARESYWSGHEWDAADPWQPTMEGARNGGYPKSKTADASRWCHEGSGAFEASVNPLFKELPNANEMAWYVLKGDAHWDNSTQWEAFGTTHTGGIWLKKLSVIAQENKKELAELKQKDPNGYDLCASSNFYGFSPKPGKPSDSVIDKYFFLPALGYYSIGKLNDLGSSSYYWSSSTYPTDSSSAYNLYFYDGYVNLGYSYRNNGFVAQPFE